MRTTWVAAGVVACFVFTTAGLAQQPPAVQVAPAPVAPVQVAPAPVAPVQVAPAQPEPKLPPMPSMEAPDPGGDMAKPAYKPPPKTKLPVASKQAPLKTSTAKGRGKGTRKAVRGRKGAIAKGRPAIRTHVKVSTPRGGPRVSVRRKVAAKARARKR